MEINGMHLKIHIRLMLLQLHVPSPIKTPCSPVLLPVEKLGQCELIPSFYGSKFSFLVIGYIAGTWLLVNSDCR